MSPLISGVQRNPDLFRDQKTKLNAQTKKAQPLKQWEPIKTTMMRRVFHTLVNAFLIGVGALQFTPRSIHGAHFNLASSPQTAFVFCFGAGDCFSRSDAAKGLGGAPFALTFSALAIEATGPLTLLINGCRMKIII